MATVTAIEWTEETWNPVKGCSKVSAGCTNCYAEVMAHRLQAMGAKGYENGFQVTLLPERLQQPIQKKKSTRYFVNSMGDLFHENVPDAFIDDVFSVIEQTPQHIYQILTKRSRRLSEYCGSKRLPTNAWMGVTVEDRKDGIQRIDNLRTVNASVRFLSIEPLLQDLGTLNLVGINWVIVGGESGPKARPMDEEWVRSIKEQCDKRNVAFFFKQWGTWGQDKVKRNKKENGRLLLGRTWSAYPNVAG
ncbi:Bacteriophage protein gp37 [Citrifermentans bremense]|uniref:Bacteriophage protein gp37 n=1 Tax=Citrifermentans bremense TaxID=60035 RepID=A0A6S6M5Y8_9BACT|nr:phage Gp37/Gp68 family protein [Citrifermentans bremense]BCG49113.1 Bacteriophage protein gp37 [Citrifermentans bremense]